MHQNVIVNRLKFYLFLTKIKHVVIRLQKEENNKPEEKDKKKKLL
jgi:hypothetical protein